MRNLPNILSASRILCSIVLFFLTGRPALFTVLYLYCGVSDIADGYFARRLGVQSALGARLDSLGDLFFYAMVVFVTFTATTLWSATLFIWLVTGTILVRLANVIVTRIRLRQWGILHTIGNKISGLLIYFMLPAYILFPQAPPTAAVIVAAIALGASAEETMILLTAKEYDPDLKSIFRKK